MAETNGDRDTRMDRIERTLEMLIADHEQFRADHKQLLIAQVLQKESIEELYKVTKEQTRQIEQLRANGSETDKRIRDLVSAIGEFIRRTQPDQRS